VNCKPEEPYLKVQKKCDFSVMPEQMSSNRSEATFNESGGFLVGRYFSLPCGMLVSGEYATSTSMLCAGARRGTSDVFGGSRKHCRDLSFRPAGEGNLLKKRGT